MRNKINFAKEILQGNEILRRGKPQADFKNDLSNL